MAVLSLAQITQMLESQGFSKAMAQSFAGIAISQSGGNTDAVYNTAYPNLPGYTPVKAGNSPEYSVGLWQINLVAHPQYTAAQMENPTTQVQAAITLYQQDGLQPWQGDPVANAIANNGDAPLTNAQLLATGTSGGGTVGGGALSPAQAAQEAATVAGTSGTNSQTYFANGQPVDQADARAFLQQTLDQWGLGSLINPDPNTGWAGAWNMLTQNDSADQVIIALQQTPQYNAAFPGMALRAKNGLPAMSPAAYLSYADSAIQMAHQVGLPVGFMTKAEIGQLIGNDVSSTELSDRLTGAYQAVLQSPAEVQRLMAQWYGAPGASVTGTGTAAAKARGALAAYFLDPQRSLPIIQNEITASQIGYTGQQAGLGTIPKNYAMMLAQEGQTESSARSGFAQISPMKPLETQLPGMAKQGTVGLTTLLGAQFEGNQPAQRAIQVAEETRKAPFAGGGGFAVNQSGVAGAGSASSQGTAGT